MRWPILLCLAACGRYDFDRSHDAPNGALDAPDLPASLVCHATGFTIPAVAPGTDLAVAHASRGYDAMWAKDGPVAGLALDSQLTQLAMLPQMIPTTAAGVPGLVDTGVAVIASLATPGGGDEIWTLTPDLQAPVRARVETSVGSRDPFASDQAQDHRIWVRGTATELVGAFVQDDGTLGLDATHPTGGPVTAMSMEDGPDHSHITWSEQVSPTVSNCYASDIRYTVNPPTPNGASLLSSDCYAVRTASGPPAADSMIVVWQTAGHIVEARYLAGSGGIMRDLSLHGRAPKVRFDGTEFWIAWIDEPGDTLQIASLDLNGNVKAVALPGWHPVGDEAFQLVRRGATVYLVVLSADTLTFLLTCA